MKKRKIIIPLCLFLSFYLGQAQLIMIDGETGEYKYEEVVQVNGLSKNEIKQRAASWLSQYYSEVDSVQSDSTGVFRLCQQPIKWTLIKKDIYINVFFDLSVKVKDNRYKYAFENFREGKLVRGDLQSMKLQTYIERFPQAYQIDAEEPIDAEITKAIESLNYYIVNGTMQRPEEEW